MGRAGDQGADVDLRPFPMLDGPPIPWYVAHAVYVHLYGAGEQTLDRIGERGGFGWGEVALMWADKAARRVSDRDRERCAAEIEAAGTLAAEPPHDPEPCDYCKQKGRKWTPDCEKNKALPGGTP